MSNSTNPRVGFSVVNLDVSMLVGREIGVYSKQFPGKKLTAKVVSAHDRQIAIESGASDQHIPNLVNRQQLILQFPYKGQLIAVRAMLQKTLGGRCSFVLEEEAVPLSQRKYRRLPIERPVKFAAFSILASKRRDLSQLRWMESRTINVSSGGVLVSAASYVEKDIFFVVHLEVDNDLLPPLLLAQVKHCHQTDDGRYLTGLEFVVRERSKEIFTPTRLREMPAALFKYTCVDREHLNRRWSQPEADESRADRSRQ